MYGDAPFLKRLRTYFVPNQYSIDCRPEKMIFLQSLKYLRRR